MLGCATDDPPRKRGLGNDTAAALVTGEVLLKKGTIKKNDRILIFNTGAAQKYPEAVREQLPRIDIKKPIDWASI